jgi:hypothetical protein
MLGDIKVVVPGVAIHAACRPRVQPYPVHWSYLVDCLIHQESRVVG